jgi:ADP-ribose pyrophosphatase
MERKNGDWTITATKKIFSNDFFTVFEDDVVQPDDERSKYATISFKPGVAVLPVDDEGFIYLTRQFRYALHRDNIEVVSGGYETHEEILDAAKRELHEEMGIDAAEWLPLGRIDAITSITDSHTDMFIARGLSFTKPEREGTETIEPVKMPLRVALGKVLAGAITHGETCVLVMRAWFEEQKKTAAGT